MTGEDWIVVDGSPVRRFGGGPIKDELADKNICIMDDNGYVIARYPSECEVRVCRDGSLTICGGSKYPEEVSLMPFHHGPGFVLRGGYHDH